MWFAVFGFSNKGPGAGVLYAVTAELYASRAMVNKGGSFASVEDECFVSLK